jgi:hypothetical protein
MNKQIPISPVHMVVDLRPQRSAGLGLAFPGDPFAASGARVEFSPNGEIRAHGVEHRLPQGVGEGLVHDLTPAIRTIGLLTEQLGEELTAFAAARGLHLPLRSLSFDLRQDRATALFGGAGRGQAAVRRSLGRVSFDPPHQPWFPRGDRPHPNTIAAVRRWNDTWGEDSHAHTDQIAERGGELVAELMSTARSLIPQRIVSR